MIANNVSFLNHSHNKLRLLFDVVKSAEKRRRNILFLQNVKNL